MWYHVTKYLGKQVTLKCNVPSGSSLLDVEGNIPRICVSDTIFFCLRATLGGTILKLQDMLSYYDNHNPCVYFTEEVPYDIPNASDFRFNHEKWFLKDTVFYYLGNVDVYKLFSQKIIVPTYKQNISKDIQYKLGFSTVITETPQEKFLQLLVKKIY